MYIVYHEPSKSIYWLGYGLYNQGIMVWFPLGQDIFFLQNVQIGSGSNPASYSMCSRRFLPRIKRLDLEADHSPPSNTKFKNEWRYTSTSTHAFMACTVTILLSLCMPHILTCVITKVRKVKCTLVQALRLCTGRTAHRGNRGIAILFLDHGTRREWGVSVTPRPHFTPG